MARYVALLRGINVGTAKQVPMADLRRAYENVGCRNVTTVLRSGSVVFDCASEPDASVLQREVERITGVPADTVIFAADRFREIAAANPLAEVSTNGSKMFVTFLSEPPGVVEVPDAVALAPERLELGTSAVYQWMPEGSMRSKVPKAFWSQFEGLQTARNANTVNKVLTLLSKVEKNP